MKKSIVTSFMIITVFNALDRVLGFFYKIFLSRELGAQNMGVYQLAMSLFLVALTFITSGIPLVVSKRTAKALAEHDEKKIRSITCAALVSGLLSGGVLIAVAAILYYPLIGMMGAEATGLLTIMLPALLFSAIYSAFRGNLWGREKYFAVSIAEVIEQVARIVTSVVLFFCGFDKLSAAAISLTSGCGVSAVAVTLFFFIGGGRLSSPKGELRPMLQSELPITLSKSAGSLVSSLLSIAVPALFVLSGYTKTQAYAIYGSAAGMAVPLLYTPLTLIGSLAFVLIPTIGACVNKAKYDSVNCQTKSAIEFSVLVACFFIPLFSVCGPKIGEIIYGDADSGLFMSISAWTLLPLSVEAITSSIMNSLDLEMKSFIGSMIGYGAQALFYLAFMRSFTVHIFAAGMGISLSVAAVLHLINIYRKTGLKPTYLFKSTVSVLLTAPCSLLTASVLSLTAFLPDIISVVLAGLCGMAMFTVLSFVFGGFEIYKFGGKSKPIDKKQARKRIRSKEA